MKARYIDAHCHVQFPEYDADSAELIARMQEEGVAGIVVGVDLESSRKAVALAEAHGHLFAAVGLHPNRVGAEAFDPVAYRALASHPKVVAIGECGLDYFRPAEVNDAVKGAQRSALGAHFDLAAELDKPLIIHARPAKGSQDAYADLVALIAEAQAYHGSKVRGDVHFFVGGTAEGEALAALGFTVSYTAVITFARDYDEPLRTLPLSTLLAETDAPYVAPVARRGERNDPLAVRDVVREIARVRGEDEEAVRQTLLANALRVFRLPGIEAA